MIRKLYVFTDGGARRNPGPAAIGVVIKDSRGKTLAKFGKFIGRATNNVAEYQAVIEALEWAISNSSLREISSKCKYQISNINFFLDSKLVVNQLNGLFKIKNLNLRNLIIKIRRLEEKIDGKISYYFISRKKNKEADLLVNQVLKRKVF